MPRAARLVLQVEALGLPAARLQVHDQDPANRRPHRGPRRWRALREIGSSAVQRVPAGGCGRPGQGQRHDEQHAAVLGGEHQNDDSTTPSAATAPPTRRGALVRVAATHAAPVTIKSRTRREQHTPDVTPHAVDRDADRDGAEQERAGCGHPSGGAGRICG